MDLSPAQVKFLAATPTAAMVTLGANGQPKVARVAVGVLDGRLLSSGTKDRVRTKRLRQDPRCTLFVFDKGYSWLALETTVTILEDEDVPHVSLKLFRGMQDRPTGPINWFGKELDEAEALKTMVQDGRVLYEFEVQHAYGMI